MFTSTSLKVKLIRSGSFQVRFEIVGWNVTHDFVYFSDLEKIGPSFLSTDILFSWRVFYSNSSSIWIGWLREILI